MEDSDKPRNDKKGVGGLVFVGCILVGIAIGLLTDQVGAGTLIGLGVGFIAMAAISASARREK